MKTEYKIIGGIGLLTLVILMVSILLISGGSNQSIPKDQIVSQNGLHWHPKLFIYIKGKKQEISKDIGIGAVHQPIHTHDASGTIHMEMQGVISKDDTMLGNFFRIWGKDFSSNKVLNYTNGSDGKVKMFVNSKENYEFENYEMKDGDNIEIRYE